MTPIRLVICCVVLLLLVVMLTVSAANAASTSIRVSARILPWLDVSATTLVSSYTVDAKAIQRGFVDLPHSLSIRLATNLRSDIDLNLENYGTGRIQINNGSNQDSDIVRIPALAVNTPYTKELNLRIILPNDIEEGDYPLQLSVSAMNI